MGENVVSEAYRLNLALLGLEERREPIIDEAGSFVVSVGYLRQFQALKKLGFVTKVGVFGLPASSFQFQCMARKQTLWLPEPPDQVLSNQQSIVYDPIGRADISGSGYPCRISPAILSVEDVLGLMVAWSCLEKVQGRGIERLIEAFGAVERPIMGQNPCFDTGRYSSGYYKNRAGVVLTYPNDWVLVTECEPMGSYGIITIKGSLVLRRALFFFDSSFILTSWKLFSLCRSFLQDLL